MKHPSAHAALLILAILFVPRSADAQTIPGWDCKQFTLEKIDADRVRLMREVECNGDKSNPGQQIFADELIGNLRTGEFEAVGNVLLVSPTARISAERVVYNTRTGFGTFYTASGSASLGDRVAQDRSMFGTLEPDIYFWGETHREDRAGQYRIHKGSFTTCVQPTPRWDIGTGNATINLEDYAVLKNAVMRVKDVPVFYLPILYYPIQSDDRATGFLLPTYGSSTFRGQSLSNAFFWAINRSQDLTLLHDWFTETGQGYGGEYRYVLGPGSEGNLRAYRLLQHEVLDGTTVVAPAVTSYELRGALAQLLPYGLRARGQVEYFSSLNTTQLYNTDIYYSSQSQRRFGGSVTGNWGGTTVTANYQRAETFSSQVQSTVGGYAPSLTANLSSKRLGSLPIYVSSTGEAAKYLYIFRNNGVEQDLSLGRFDIQPSVRVALSNLPFLNVNASVGFRDTYFTQSNDALNHQVPEGLNRHYWDLRADLVGPTFSRVFTPNNAIADRLKHVIEPTLSLQRITSFDNQARVPQLGGSADFVVGGVTRMTYGLANRVLVRKAAGDPAAAPSASAPRDLLNVSMTQSYYTDPFASQYRLQLPIEPHQPHDQLVLADRGHRPHPAEHLHHRPVADGVRPPGLCAAHHPGERLEQLPHRTGQRRLEPHELHHGAVAAHAQCLDELELRAREERRSLRDRLEYQRRLHPAAAMGGVLQRAMLWIGGGIPAVQVFSRRHCRRSAGPPVQSLVHPGRCRQLLELLRRIRRRSLLARTPARDSRDPPALPARPALPKS